MNNSLFAKDPVIFEIVKKGDFNTLKYYLDTTKTSINITNYQGYSPLHVLIDNFIEYRTDLRDKDPYLFEQGNLLSDSYRSCIRLLLDKGASATQLTPEGWTALQYAVMKGKWQPTGQLLEKSKGGDIRDKNGNTLLHLSLLINPDDPHEDFWKRLIDGLRSYNITPSTVNFKGQTPIVYYLSEPRCNPLTNKPKSTPKLLGAAPANSVSPPCHTSMTYNMIDNFLCESCILVPDFDGKRALDYATTFNKWCASNLTQKEQVYAYTNETNKKYQKVAEQNKKATDEYLQKLAEWQAQEENQKLDLSFTRTYYYQCNSYQKNRIKFDEPVVVSVTPEQISVSSLSPYHGKFKIAKSGYEIIDGNKWMIYHLEKTSSNSTYKIIGFYNNGCNIVTNIGSDLICY